MKSFSSSHVATLCRYLGTSFIAGAVAHGAFSEARSALTALIGVAAYVIGSIMQVRLESSKKHAWGAVIVAGAIAAVGIGFFTGGLQHFPDSPNRSVWVVPLGFLLSGFGLLMLSRTENEPNETQGRKDYLYLIFGFLFVTVLSAGGWSYWHERQDGHHHGDHHGRQDDSHDDSHGDSHHD
jgi:hypothetical protein